nr:immunoglobulin light chain junction region [Macaca mulatta]MPO04623.1 immunoglobulin light chain junction region [Macaca mulatta]MPO05327.1 immunoglobulin light chain junction region [Macaca mulatta]MPO05664.1 immunoglobulin light chain junction region [Macaca mulatta]MPO07151.1 immunoglobulin light chain junction region [Macaca mulatta]
CFSYRSGITYIF